MREILFRGKRIDNGEWIQGHYGGYTLMSGVTINAISVPYKNSIGGSLCYDVDSTTVGQYTGLTDKNDKKIFEGDIVVVPLSGKPAKGIVEYFKTDICGFAVITQPQYSNYVLQKNYAYEVIGNIHDNPELLEVEE